MCRLAAFPPGTPKEYAHEVVSAFVGGNDDGVGSVYLDKGEFIVKKYPYCYREAVTKKDPLFEHMPYDGWTLAHVRMATHGKNAYENTHPIIRGDLAGVHNGVFSDSKLVRAALHKATVWQGETDTEVGLYMLDQMGPKAFNEVMPSWSGVWIAMHRDGRIFVSKQSGDLENHKMSNNTYCLASEFPHGMSSDRVSTGWAIIDPTGGKYSGTIKKEESHYYAGRGCFSGSQASSERYDRHYRDAFGQKDIAFPLACHTGGSSTATPVIIKPKPIGLELWDWPDEQAMVDYLAGLI